jgi:hypothetical protein
MTEVQGSTAAVESGPVRYQSPDEDSARWTDFGYRPGDIVISTRSKSGTTWMQMICALLIFQTPDLPQPLGQLSPWLDWLGTPLDDLRARLAAQDHRRFIKSHTPLDGIPLDRRATYIVVARHPLDMAVSLYHQGNNLDRERIRLLTGQPEPVDPPAPRPPLHEWLLSWIDSDDNPRQHLDSLPGVLWHFADAWNRRHQPNVILVHYDDLSADLDRSMRRLAARLDIEVPAAVWPVIVAAARFDQMRARADVLVPGAGGILKSPAQFFRRGSSGAGGDVLTDDEVGHYRRRVEPLGPPELMEWLHRHQWQ